jgi:hypothetical protein
MAISQLVVLSRLVAFTNVPEALITQYLDNGNSKDLCSISLHGTIQKITIFIKIIFSEPSYPQKIHNLQDTKTDVMLSTISIITG